VADSPTDPGRVSRTGLEARKRQDAEVGMDCLNVEAPAGQNDQLGGQRWRNYFLGKMYSLSVEVRDDLIVVMQHSPEFFAVYAMAPDEPQLLPRSPGRSTGASALLPARLWRICRAA
jgi:hypothetical protein